MTGLLRRLGTTLAWTFALPLVLIVAISLWSSTQNAFFFPPLWDVLATLPETWNPTPLVEDVLPSLARLAAGLGIAVVASLVVGTTLGLSRGLYAVCEPTLTFVRSLPAPALLPVLLIFFGIGDTAKVITIALGATWPMLVNVIDGVRALPTMQRETMLVLGFPWWKRAMFSCRQATPQFFAGLRQSLAIAVILMVVSEMVMSTNGIGYAIIQFQRTFAIASMWSGILLIGIIGTLLAWALEQLERRSLRWHTGMNRLTELAR